MDKNEITNIIDYVIWRGDLPFERDHFNEVDALILSRFSYMDMKNILWNDENGMTVAEAYEKYHANEEERPKFAVQDPELFRLMADSERFRNLYLSYHDFQFSNDEVEQFSTITISYGNNWHFLSFRGTDNTINGWKEDLLMTFDEEVASQSDALEYINLVASHTTGDLFLGGHSKGGNLAVYASLFCNDEIAKRIKGVFSFDGPGLHQKLLEGIENKPAFPFVATYMPQSSVFGKMLSHKELQVTVHSNAAGVMQHDIYTWEVVRKDFVLSEENTAFSRMFDEAFHDYLAKLTREERGKVVSIIFDALEKCDVETMDDFSKHFVRNLITVMKHMNGLDENEQKLVKEAFGIIGDSLKDDIIDEVTNYIPFLKKEQKTEETK